MSQNGIAHSRFGKGPSDGLVEWLSKGLSFVPAIPLTSPTTTSLELNPKYFVKKLGPPTPSSLRKVL
jgi:hypothetical protein